ncbi:MAG: hypothetical protein J2P50_06880 [Hyphomicrobiaceae bacterium]|nr:hypothetical protein [Hyphomicrobiaceae bacterium]
MRTLMAIGIAIVLGGVMVANATAQTDRKRSMKPQQPVYAQPRTNAKERALSKPVQCEHARHEDPTGAFADYPCWAGEAFARGLVGNHD